MRVWQAGVAGMDEEATTTARTTTTTDEVLPSQTPVFLIVLSDRFLLMPHTSGGGGAPAWDDGYADAYGQQPAGYSVPLPAGVPAQPRATLPMPTAGAAGAPPAAAPQAGRYDPVRLLTNLHRC